MSVSGVYPGGSLRNWDALHALIARRYGPNGPYYGFQSPELDLQPS